MLAMQVQRAIVASLHTASPNSLRNVIQIGRRTGDGSRADEVAVARARGVGSHGGSPFAATPAPHPGAQFPQRPAENQCSTNNDEERSNDSPAKDIDIRLFGVLCKKNKCDDGQEAPQHQARRHSRTRLRLTVGLFVARPALLSLVHAEESKPVTSARARKPPAGRGR